MELKDAQGALLSQNFYWYAADSETYRGMNSLPQVAVTAKAVAKRTPGARLTSRLRWRIQDRPLRWRPS
jgi:hypothetical protein